MCTNRNVYVSREVSVHVVSKVCMDVDKQAEKKVLKNECLMIL